jgi:hypothetical protein
MLDLHKQIVRGKHVLLYGNVADQYMLGDLKVDGRQDEQRKARYLQLTPYLLDYLREEGYEIVGRYDIADGLELADPSMQGTFEQIAASRGREDPSGASQPAGPPSGPARVRPSTPPPRQPPQARTDRVPERRQAEQTFAAIGRVLSQSAIGAAFVIDCSDKLNETK